MSEPVELELGDGVARLRLNRPEAGNAIDLPLARALRAHAEALGERDDVGAVILEAAGKSFCVGGDLGYMSSAGDQVGAAVAELVGEFHAAIRALRDLGGPVIASVQGVAAGGGMSLMLASDLAIAAESALFTMAYTAAGLTPDGGGTLTLRRIIGVRRATELILTNRRLDTAEALEAGILNYVVPDEELSQVAGDLAAGLAAGPRGAFAASKRLLATDADLDRQLDAEGRSISERAAEPDGREGIAAFLKKRPPHFGKG